MKKLHMGTVSYGFDSMDEVAHQLAMAFGTSAEQGERRRLGGEVRDLACAPLYSSHEERIHHDGSATRHERSQGHVLARA